MRGSIFENLVISNYIKESYFKGMKPNAYYWRDSNGLEVDLVTEENQQLKLYEIKSSATMNEKFFSSLNKLCILSKTPLKNANVVYGGNTTLNASDNHGGYISWMDL